MTSEEKCSLYRVTTSCLPVVISVLNLKIISPWMTSLTNFIERNTSLIKMMINIYSARDRQGPYQNWKIGLKQCRNSSEA